MSFKPKTKTRNALVKMYMKKRKKLKSTCPIMQNNQPKSCCFLYIPVYILSFNANGSMYIAEYCPPSKSNLAQS